MKKLLVSPVLFIAIAIIAQTICNYLSPPYPTNLTSSKSGYTIAWVFNDKGSRNIYTANADGNNVTRITNFSGDIFIAFTSLIHPLFDDQVLQKLKHSPMTKSIRFLKQ